MLIVLIAPLMAKFTYTHAHTHTKDPHQEKSPSHIDPELFFSASVQIELILIEMMADELQQDCPNCPILFLVATFNTFSSS